MGGFGDSILDSEGDGSSGTDSDSETFTPETHGRTFAEPGGPTSGPGGYTTPGGTTGTDEGSCVIEGTLIQTQRGSIPVEWVELGDKVYSYDFDSCKFGYFEVLEILLPVKKASWFKITTALGYTLSCTADHPIFSTSIESGELPVSEAEIGDPVYVFQDGEIVKDFLVSKEKITSSVIPGSVAGVIPSVAMIADPHQHHRDREENNNENQAETMECWSKIHFPIW